MSTRPDAPGAQRLPMFPEASTRFRDLLPRDHKRLEAMLDAILELTHVDLRSQLDEHWTVYEEGVLAHLDAEEMFLLPELARHDAARADQIRAEHTRIRALLAEIGVGLELHIIREEQMQKLATVLRAHAEVEESDLYEWADEKAPAGALQALARRLRATWERGLGTPKTSDGREEDPPAPRGRARVGMRPRS